ncbi:bifunctional diaminohydroxyphosphoribosylaminopyrimidine deaminase/5-amino-6-(5-phosphoribosylamino)uracil reductase RibD [Vibrio diabolicus]|uniref:bifunctional diaminohydroxyphosphoribosylaminopyrimidine deaminase/5-amino-6-(5-phosphoribosylamino)uracil reductase RibD n=1 Tax=Vibrio diabolicus TaxID=50719 RepID=UPI00215F21C1|nr:bifunctional diaminohydroxyphosphoribosylaminopyrimidine deaminase/5-amino-6-(5-phosphoribosylamino)uracil reductase RibD [Vibrio diabolicus]MCS0316074.1 bifunctional diaminohydroxyphosphoribosylaminopyrimidine deaminase/5-amino-6-(5-phosphoribosylamino)uracil reductase RibD [Vibrio diabolicus]
MNDEHYMRLALNEATQGYCSTSPNPRVGCVLVKNGQVMASGYHERAGGPHAEVAAIHNLSEQVEGLTAYVTLEPCSHYGRTPPCCQALITLGVSRVVVAMRDPNPLVAGRGIAALEQAGIDVLVGIGELEARQLNRGYVKRMQGQGPWLVGKVAMSADGGMGLASGESKWITSPAARKDAMGIRASSCAILTGIQTIVADDPLLNVRLPEHESPVKQPDLILLDPELRIDLGAAVLGSIATRRVRVVTLARYAKEQKRRALEKLGCDVHALPEKNHRICLNALHQWLLETQYNEVMVESGPTLMSGLLDARMLDELIVYQAPMLLGANSLSLSQKAVTSLTEAQRFKVGGVKKIGDDLKIHYRLK